MPQAHTTGREDPRDMWPAQTSLFVHRQRSTVSYGRRMPLGVLGTVREMRGGIIQGPVECFQRMLRLSPFKVKALRARVSERVFASWNCIPDCSWWQRVWYRSMQGTNLLGSEEKFRRDKHSLNKQNLWTMPVKWIGRYVNESSCLLCDSSSREMKTPPSLAYPEPDRTWWANRYSLMFPITL